MCAAFLNLGNAFNLFDHIILLEWLSIMGDVVLNYNGLLIIYISLCVQHVKSLAL